MAIDTVPIRASIFFGSIEVKTPYILSFSVNKKRNSKSTFQASVKLHGDELEGITDNEIEIYAGEYGNEKKIFTGFILSATPSPVWDDPKYIVLNISGADILHRLDGQKFTRRQIGSENKWAVINGVAKKAQKPGMFRVVNHDVVLPTDGGFATEDQQEDKSHAWADLSKFAKPVGRSPSRQIELNFALKTE